MFRLQAAQAASAKRPAQVRPSSARSSGPSAVSGGHRAHNGRAAAKASPAPAPLTPEQAAQRREMMAAAAEARMKALQETAAQQRFY